MKILIYARDHYAHSDLWEKYFPDSSITVISYPEYGQVNIKTNPQNNILDQKLKTGIKYIVDYFNVDHREEEDRTYRPKRNDRFRFNEINKFQFNNLNKYLEDADLLIIEPTIANPDFNRIGQINNNGQGFKLGYKNKLEARDDNNDFKDFLLYYIVKKMLDTNKPIMGTCMGHQMLAKLYGFDLGNVTEDKSNRDYGFYKYSSSEGFSRFSTPKEEFGVFKL